MRLQAVGHAGEVGAAQAAGRAGQAGELLDRRGHVDRGEVGVDGGEVGGLGGHAAGLAQRRRRRVGVGDRERLVGEPAVGDEAAGAGGVHDVAAEEGVDAEDGGGGGPGQQGLVDHGHTLKSGRPRISPRTGDAPRRAGSRCDPGGSALDCAARQQGRGPLDAGDRMEATETRSLPENAYLPLAPGETYQPIVPAGAGVPEATWRSVLWGVFLCVIFTAASAYSGLKVGQVMEAAIPISILAIGLGRVYARRSTLLENVIITGIGGVSGSVVAGAVFTLPALYILKLDPHPWQTIFICVAGGCWACSSCIPLRRYFVRETHGAVPLPGGHRHHRGAGDRREGRLAGDAAAAGHRHRRGLRLLRHHLPGLEGDHRPALPPGGGGRWPRRPR